MAPWVATQQRNKPRLSWGCQLMAFGCLWLVLRAPHLIGSLNTLWGARHVLVSVILGGEATFRSL